MKDFGAQGDGVTDDTHAIQAALQASRCVYFPRTSGGYAIKSNASFLIHEDTVVDANNQRLIFDGGMLGFQGLIVNTGSALLSHVERYERTVRLTKVADIQPGDLLVLITAQRPSTDWLDPKQDCVPVDDVSGDEVHLLDGLNFAYGPSDPSIEVRVYRPARFEFRNARIELVMHDAERTPKAALHLEGLRGILFSNLSIIGMYPFDRVSNIFRTGIRVYYCNGINILSSFYEAMSYPVGIYGATRSIFEKNTVAKYCHHSHADVGGWSDGYILSGLSSQSAYQAISTHPCFNAHASNFECRSDLGLSNWRCCGGSLRNGYIHSLVDDSSELPQFQNTTPAMGFEYINSDADFSCINVTFDMPNRETMAPLYVKFGRHIKIDGVVAFACAVGGEGSGVTSVEFGPNNQFGEALRSAPPRELVKASVVRGITPE